MKGEKHAIALGYDGYNAPTVQAKASNQLAHELIEALNEQGCLIHEDAHLLAWLEKLSRVDCLCVGFRRKNAPRLERA